MQHLTNARVIALLASGSKPNINELAKFIIAQDAFKTNDPDTIKMKDRAIKLADREESVIIRGESGTGKELVAQMLHGSRTGNFVAVNSTAVTETLFESELFGHVRGSFTGAATDRAGLITYANNGTLFFDEIGDMPLTLQPKILRVLQSRKYRIVGSNSDQQVKCRIIAAPHMNLEALVKQGKFRLDLYQRLACFELHIKPLRERKEDILLHVRDERLLHVLSELWGKTGNEFLLGNVRELENIIKRWEVLGEI